MQWPGCAKWAIVDHRVSGFAAAFPTHLPIFCEHPIANMREVSGWTWDFRTKSPW